MKLSRHSPCENFSNLLTNFLSGILAPAPLNVKILVMSTQQWTYGKEPRMGNLLLTNYGFDTSTCPPRLPANALHHLPTNGSTWATVTVPVHTNQSGRGIALGVLRIGLYPNV